MNNETTNFQIYCNSLTNYSRLSTRDINIGNIPLGGSNPIRIQSMTTTDTMNTIATVEQTIRMVDAGCEYVRITAPSMKEAQNLAEIKKELKRRSYNVPLIADIHFTPNAAELAAKIVEKVRINPGNYFDKKKFETLEYTDSEYNAEIERIASRLTPLLKICKDHGTAMRIGANHGSLSDRIMSRYGDSPLGMVESAMEFIRICEANNFYNLVLSMKASNPLVMVEAYRLLVKTMLAEGMNYPLHLGVTEAGDGEDGRVKSAVGIGSLLEDGIGDTIRVSLTEEPEFEVPVAIALRDRYSNYSTALNIPNIETYPVNPFAFERRHSIETLSLGANNPPSVIADFSTAPLNDKNILRKIGYTFDEVSDKWNISDQAADMIYLGSQSCSIELPQSLSVIKDYELCESSSEKSNSYPLLKLEDYLSASANLETIHFVVIDATSITDTQLSQLKGASNCILIVESSSSYRITSVRSLFVRLINMGILLPIVLKFDFSEDGYEQFLLNTSIDFGSLFLDGLGDAVWVKNTGTNRVGHTATNRILFGILQAARMRISKTEYIACPSCGRTLFDLVETTNSIRRRTSHLKGLKIGIMGCIVNGPGEMADADYGYVGSGEGKITLYRGKEVVERNVQSGDAVEKLIDIIKGDGRWINQPLASE